MDLISIEASHIVALDLSEAVEEVLPYNDVNDLFVDGREVLKSLRGRGTEKLVPRDEATKITLEVKGLGVEIGLAIEPQLVETDKFGATYILDHCRLYFVR